ncbi:hypothetical protein [Rhizobium leguminosarum]|uniref:hypothetical protein n=1 Tax=Rhizobium leguminosarum TaxID=384 RepID=UPI001C90AFEC|nr:hypothetical protein [Rhizobium leguminosarum]
MSAIVTDANARWLPGEPVSLAEIATLSNARRRDAQLLGLERVAKDITDLDSYLHPRSPVNDDLGACFAVQQATRVRPSFSHRPKDRSTPKDQVQQIAFRSCSEWSQLRVGKAEPAISIRRYSVPRARSWIGILPEAKTSSQTYHTSHRSAGASMTGLIKRVSIREALHEPRLLVRRCPVTVGDRGLSF